MNESVDYNVQLESWYSPAEIIKRYEMLRDTYGDEALTKREFKRAREMFCGAITLLGAYVLSEENVYFLQGNNQSTSPDVVAAKQTERNGAPILAEISQLEIVEMEDHYPGNDVVEFLKATKLSPKKGYNEHTLIVCVVNKQIPIDRKEIAKKLAEITPAIKPYIYITGRVGKPEQEEFSIFTPYPRPTKIVLYKVQEVIGAYSIPSRIRFNLGMADRISYEKAELEPVNTYNIFGLDQKLIEKMYKNQLK